MPFKSQAQRRLFYAKARSGEISESKVREWERETPKNKKLPEKVAGIFRPRNIIAVGALATPYAVGRSVQKKQREQIVEKTAAFLAGLADGMSKVAEISMGHGARRLAQQALALKNRVTRQTPHLSALPGAERFRAFAMENPGVVERSKKLHKTIAGASGLAAAKNTI